uniref:Uncharacterized protein n=1 Tax=Prolemur simus TaxID=1328070 RepID=A0A8C9A110_PROSS
MHHHLIQFEKQCSKSSISFRKLNTCMSSHANTFFPILCMRYDSSLTHFFAVSFMSW